MAEYGQFSENTTVTREHVYDVLHNTEHLYKDVKSEEANCYDYIENKTLLKEENTDNKKDLDIYENIKEEVKKYGQDTQNFINFKIENGGKTEKCEDINLIPTIKKEENIDPTVLIPSSDSSPVDVTLYNEDSEESCKQGGNSGSDNRSTNILQCGLCGCTTDDSFKGFILMFEKNALICYDCHKCFVIHIRLNEKRSVSCITCNIVIENVTSLSTHLQYHKCMEVCDCESCKNSYSAHLRMYGAISVPKNVCIVCNESFRFKYELSCHSLSHPKSVKCKVCHELFRSKHELSIHYISHGIVNNVTKQGTSSEGHKPKKICSAASSKVVTTETCLFHKHFGVCKFTCKICFESFYSQRGLTVHTQKKHKNCNMSHLKFVAVKVTYKPATNNAHSEKVYTCGICSESFYSEFYINTHLTKMHNLIEI